MTSPMPGGRSPEAQAAASRVVRTAGTMLRGISYFLIVGGLLLLLIALDLGGVAETLASDSASSDLDDGSRPMTESEIKTFALWFAVGMLVLGIAGYFIGRVLIRAAERAEDDLQGGPGSATPG